jgi:hypothetical protein
MKQFRGHINEKVIVAHVRVLFEVLSLCTAENSLLEMTTLTQPLHPVVILFLQRLLTWDSPQLQRFGADRPAMRLLFLVRPLDLVLGCWRLYWHSLDTSTHVAAFLADAAGSFSFRLRLAMQRPPSALAGTRRVAIDW